MRYPLVAGNWKMFKTVAEARELIAEMIPALAVIKGVEKVLCPPFTALLAAHALVQGTDISVGAQDMHWEDAGAYTGEISAGMVAEFCKYVIIGHSERRAYFNETDASVNRKARAAIAAGLRPIVCVGETLQENETGKTGEVVLRQMRDGLADLRLANDPALVIAYEPVWAIGTGRAASGEGANQVIAYYIRTALEELFGSEIAQAVRVLYGGSVKASNAAEFFAQSEIDGALVGGASLKVAEFIPITQAAVKP